MEKFKEIMKLDKMLKEKQCQQVLYQFQESCRARAVGGDFAGSTRARGVRGRAKIERQK